MDIFHDESMSVGNKVKWCKDMYGTFYMMSYLGLWGTR